MVLACLTAASRALEWLPIASPAECVPKMARH